jgi:hypothetical protein
MKHLIIAIVILIGGIIVPIKISGQKEESDRLRYLRAIQEAEAVQSAADRIIDNPLAVIKIKAKAASVLWTQSPEQSRLIFTKLWDKIESQSDNAFDKEEARIALLKYLFPKDRTLANRLLKKTADKSQDNEVSNYEKMNGTDPETRRLAFTAYSLADADVVLAASVLEQGLAHGTPPMIAPILTRIREKNPLLANYVALRTIENFSGQSRTAAVFGLNTITPYLFPWTPSSVISDEVEESDENLRSVFMSAGYQILKESLLESDATLIKQEQLSKKNLGFRNFSQAMLAAVLATLAPRYAPQLYSPLADVAQRLISTLPPQFASGIQTQVAAVKAKISKAEATPDSESEVSESDIIGAVARGDFKVAQTLIDKLKNESKKKIWMQLLQKAQIKSFLTNGELLDALITARKIEDGSQRMFMLAEISKAAHKKRDKVLSTDVLYEARKTNSDSLPKSIRATTLFAIAADTAYFSALEATLMLEEGVETVNSLDDSLKDAAKISFSDEQNKFIDSAEMLRAFAALGQTNMEDTLLTAGKFKNKYVEMMAKLATVEKTIIKASSKTNPKMRQNRSPETRNN